MLIQAPAHPDAARRNLELLAVPDFSLFYLCPKIICILGTTTMHHLTMGICPEKCVIRGFCHCVNIIECTNRNLDGLAYYS